MLVLESEKGKKKNPQKKGGRCENVGEEEGEHNPPFNLPSLFVCFCSCTPIRFPQTAREERREREREAGQRDRQRHTATDMRRHKHTHTLSLAVFAEQEVLRLRAELASREKKVAVLSDELKEASSGWFLGSDYALCWPENLHPVHTHPYSHTHILAHTHTHTCSHTHVPIVHPHSVGAMHL